VFTVREEGGDEGGYELEEGWGEEVRREERRREEVAERLRRY
jgi:hypothetical protein